MVRRLVALLVALAIAVAVPPVLGAMPAGAMTAAGDCPCTDADQDCGKAGKMACSGALACAVQCGIVLPMMAGETGLQAMALAAGPGSSGAAPLLPSAVTAPPLRPPTDSIPA